MIFLFIEEKCFVCFFLFQGGTLEAEARQHGKQFEGSIFPFRRDCRHDPVPHRLRRVPRYCHVEGIPLVSNFQYLHLFNSSKLKNPLPTIHLND